MTTQGLQSKVKRLLSSNISLSSKGMLISLRGVSEFIPSGGNDLAARRQLQHQLEEKDLDHCKQLVAGFAPVERLLESAGKVLEDLDKTITLATEKVERAKENTSTLVERAAALQTERATLKGKSRVVQKLLHQFQLDPKYSKALGGSEVGPDFLEAIARVNDIRKNCHILLRTYQRVGVEMVESLSKKQENAYRKLFHWTQNQVQMIAQSPIRSTANPNFVKALALLRERPAYFSHCFDALADARRVVIIKRFIAALCRGGPNGQPRPIEIHAGDPIRYVSDMLAWVHQTLADEREFLTSIISPRSQRSQGSRMQGEDEKKMKMGKETDEKQDSTDVILIGAVSRVLEGVARPLSVRVEQSLVFQPSSTISYNLRSVLDFYAHTLRPLVDPAGIFANALNNLVKKAQETFVRLTKAQTDQLREATPPYTSDLSPPAAIQTLLDQITQLIRVHESCLVEAHEKDKAFIPILEDTIEAVKDSGEDSGKGLSGPNRAVYLLNILCSLESALKSSEPSIRHVSSKITAEIKTRVSALVKEQADLFLKKSGLYPSVKALSTRNRKIPMEEVKGLDEMSLVCYPNNNYPNQPISLQKSPTLYNPPTKPFLDGSIVRSCGYATVVCYMSRIT
ncbi:hypothetical protein AAMO2058_000982100 [Amorphochlora amoebiformis]